MESVHGVREYQEQRFSPISESELEEEPEAGRVRDWEDLGKL